MDSVREFRDSPVAVIEAGGTGSFLSHLHTNFTVPLTLWTCRSVNSRCYQSFLSYIKQSVAFPRPSFVFAPSYTGLPRGIFEEVKRLDVSHPHVHWVFAVDQHAAVDALLANHSCQVVTVVEKDVSVAHDRYRSCRERVTSSSLVWKTLLGPAESEGTYPRDKNLAYGMSYWNLPPVCTAMGPVAYMSSVNKLLKFRHPEGAALLDAYLAINTTVNLHCEDNISGETMLKEKRVDFILYGWLKNGSKSVSEYKYGLYSPSSGCFYSRSRAPVPPSFSDSWIFMSWCLVWLTPLCIVIFFTFRAQNSVYSNHHVPMAAVVMFLVNSFLGRSPQGLNVSTSATRLAIVVWSLGMSVVGNFLQSSVTASRSVPALSAEVRTKEQVLMHLQEGSLLPCVTRESAHIRGKGNFQPLYKPLFDVLEDAKCESSCVEEFVFGCMEKARRGTHMYFSVCREPERRHAFKWGLIVGEETVAAVQPLAPVHLNFPFR
ncbi:hypothetical protein HPB50_018997 [Hyalomma asiaticum]|uniref:Uncharacterized protein n=1 Tax=Hyalomma asiaticum TaxID=266040 RepID=A0ACB7T2N2_HYAAI|nr:hypothetical protein HPB50_018997 [Hyalomma asiaticum]